MRFKRGDVEALIMLFSGNFSTLLAILGTMVTVPRIAESYNPEFQDYYNAFEKMVFRKVRCSQ